LVYNLNLGTERVDQGITVAYVFTLYVPLLLYILVRIYDMRMSSFVF